MQAVKKKKKTTHIKCGNWWKNKNPLARCHPSGQLQYRWHDHRWVQPSEEPLGWVVVIWKMLLASVQVKVELLAACVPLERSQKVLKTSFFSDLRGSPVPPRLRFAGGPGGSGWLRAAPMLGCS